VIQVRLQLTADLISPVTGSTSSLLGSVTTDHTGPCTSAGARLVTWLHKARKAVVGYRRRHHGGLRDPNPAHADPHAYTNPDTNGPATRAKATSAVPLVMRAVRGRPGSAGPPRLDNHGAHKRVPVAPRIRAGCYREFHSALRSFTILSGLRAAS